jgi:HK97 family phage prohead protease
VVYSRAAVAVESLSDEDRTVEVIASTEDIDGHRTILRGPWRLDRFRSNPVVLFSHNSRELPIGTASDVRVTDKQLRAKVEFSTADLNEKAEQVWKNVKAKKVRGVSVGFFPHSVKFETHEDRDVLVLSDLELMELSITPVPSNPQALAQLRARAIGEKETRPEPTPAAPAAQPEPPEIQAMTTPAPEQNLATPTVARALGLPAGATESDMVARATSARELEIGVVSLTGVTSTAEALGAVRALKAKADRADALEAELTKVRAERDKQDFETQITRGLAERKLSIATAKLEREKFDRKLAEGRGAEAVAELKGFVDVAPTLHGDTVRQPAPGGGERGAAPTYNGKTYAELKPMQRARLAQENPQLYRLMKDDWEAGKAA